MCVSSELDFCCVSEPTATATGRFIILITIVQGSKCCSCYFCSRERPIHCARIANSSPLVVETNSGCLLQPSLDALYHFLYVLRPLPPPRLGLPVLSVLDCPIGRDLSVQTPWAPMVAPVWLCLLSSAKQHHYRLLDTCQKTLFWSFVVHFQKC